MLLQYFQVLIYDTQIWQDPDLTFISTVFLLFCSVYFLHNTFSPMHGHLHIYPCHILGNSGKLPRHFIGYLIIGERRICNWVSIFMAPSPFTVPTKCNQFMNFFVLNIFQLCKKDSSHACIVDKVNSHPLTSFFSLRLSSADSRYNLSSKVYVLWIQARSVCK